MEIKIGKIENAYEILELQKLAYQSEAVLYNDYNIPPLRQSLNSIKSDFNKYLFLIVFDSEKIIGSVKAKEENDSCYIGRLIVHPNYQGRGIGTRLMNAVEGCFPNAKRFELFTGSKSFKNINLYKKVGYKIFKDNIVSGEVGLVYLEKYKLTTDN